MSLPPNRANGHRDNPPDDNSVPRGQEPPIKPSEISASGEELARLASELGRLVGPFTA